MIPIWVAFNDPWHEVWFFDPCLEFDPQKLKLLPLLNNPSSVNPQSLAHLWRSKGLFDDHISALQQWRRGVGIWMNHEEQTHGDSGSNWLINWYPQRIHIFWVSTLAWLFLGGNVGQDTMHGCLGQGIVLANPPSTNRTSGNQKIDNLAFKVSSWRGHVTCRVFIGSASLAIISYLYHSTWLDGQLPDDSTEENSCWTFVGVFSGTNC